MLTASHRGGAGAPLVLLHGFADTWRTWQLVLPALERRHDVLAPTLPGHAGGPPLPATVTDGVMADAVEAAMDAAGMRTAHLVGSSLGGTVALQLAARGRARSVVALAPAGGWGTGDESYRDLLAAQLAMVEGAGRLVPHVDAVLATREGRRQATRAMVVRFEHIPVELLAHQLRGVAGCVGARPLVEHALRSGWAIDPERVTCPMRIVWGAADALLPWPSAARRFQQWFPAADWVVLDDVGHCPQLDVPLEAAELILGHTA